MSLTPIKYHELEAASVTLADALNACGVEFGIMGGAGVFLLSKAFLFPARSTNDIDVIVQPDAAKKISAESISRDLIAKFPEKFVAVDQYGVKVPAVSLQRGTQRILVEIELFDVDAWPNRPQYNLLDPANSRTPVQIQGKSIHVLNPDWLLREKILSQSQREGSNKEATDIVDISNLLTAAGDNKLTYEADDLVAALNRLIEKRPDLKDELEEAINCPAVFS